MNEPTVLEDPERGSLRSEPPVQPVPLARAPRQARTLTVLLLLAGALVAAVVWPLWKPILLATAVGATLYSTHDRLAARFHGHRYLSASVLTLAVLVLIVAPLVVLVAEVADQVTELYQWFQATLSSGGIDRLVARAPDWVQGAFERLNALIPSLKRDIASQATVGGKWAAGSLAAGAMATGELLFNLAMFAIALFFILSDGARFARFVQSLLPLRNETTEAFFHDFRAVCQNVLGVGLAVGTIQTVLATAGYWVAGAPHVLLLGLLTLIASFIPTLGTALILLPVAVGLALTGSWIAALGLTAWGLLVVGTVDNLLRSLWARGGMHLHGAAIFFSFIGGVAAFGAVGLLLGPLALAFFVTSARLWRRERFWPGAGMPEVVDGQALRASQ